MEIGALVCKPKLPLCSLCPLTQNCKAYINKDFLIKNKNKFNKIKYFEANIYENKNKYLLIKNKKFNFLKNLVIFPMTEINKEKFKQSASKKINVKMSNMNMKIIINKNNRFKTTKNSLFLNKSNIKANIFYLHLQKKYLIHFPFLMKKIAIVGAGISGLFLANLLEKDKSFSYKIFEKKFIRFKRWIWNTIIC